MAATLPPSCSDKALTQKATEKSGRSDPEAEPGKEDLRLEEVVARPREPLRGLSQPCSTEPAGSASQVSIRRILTAFMVHLISLHLACHSEIVLVQDAQDRLTNLRG